jgi:ABC-type polysaccharide/polyol phosphate export permease
VLILLLVLFTSGLSILCAAANLFFRDVKYLVEVVLTFAIFFTPVLYDAAIAGQWRSLLMLNPIAPLLEGLNASVVLGQQPDLPWVGYSTVMAFLVAWVGVSLFRSLEPRFAESV